MNTDNSLYSLSVLCPLMGGLQTVMIENIHSGTYQMGRDPYGDIIIPDIENMVSKKHCRLRVNKKGSLFITDLSSKNGTYIVSSEGNKLKLIPLKEYDITPTHEIHLVRFVIRFGHSQSVQGQATTIIKR